MRMRFLLVIFLICMKNAYSQIDAIENPTINLRASILLFPTTPLLTLEVKTIGNATIQIESNFINTYGVNLKYFLKNRMKDSYIFLGNAFVKNSLLRKDEKITFLPYLGYGYAYRFGSRLKWTADSRFGLGITTNADSNNIYPIIKIGIGRVF